MTATTVRTRTSRQERRCFHWDLDVDMTRRARADTRAWLRAKPARIGAEPPLPDPEIWAANMSRAIVEVALGLRPAAQLQRWVVPPLYAAIQHLDGRREYRGSGPCRPTGWRSSEVRPGVVETATVIRTPEGTHLVALRLESFRGRWITTALEFV